MDKNKANKTVKRQGAGRPKIIVDIEILKNLASIGCPDYEIASVLNVSARTLKRNFAITRYCGFSSYDRTFVCWS